MPQVLADNRGNILLVNDDGSLNTTQLSTSSTQTVVTAKAATSTTVSVASSSTAATILAANANRLGATIANNSTSILYLTLGASSTSTAFTATLAPLATGVAAYYEVPFRYTGIITGQHGTASNGAVCVTEVSA